MQNLHIMLLEANAEFAYERMDTMNNENQVQTSSTDLEEKSNSNLIKCPVCGQEISSQATVCPHCGQPTEFAKKNAEQRRETAAFASKLLINAISGLICLIIFFVSLSHLNSWHRSSTTVYGIVAGALGAIICATLIIVECIKNEQKGKK